MNLLTSINNPTKYLTNSAPITLPNPDVWMRFENNLTNSGTNALTNGATSGSANISFNSTTKKEGSYSLAFTSTGTSQTIYKFPSSGVYQLPNTGSFPGYSFSLWFYYTSYSDNGTMVQYFVNDYTTTWLLINFQTGTSGLQARFGNAGFNTSLSTLGISSGSWNHLAFTIQSNGFWIVVINGTRITSFDTLQTTNLSSMIQNPPDTTSGRGTFLFGGYNTSAPILWTGFLDSFRVYSSPLTEAQLKQIYANGN